MSISSEEIAAKFIGRAATFEKAITLLISSPAPNAPLVELLKVNLSMRRQNLQKDLTDAGLSAGLLPVATSAAVQAENAILHGVQGGRYVPLP
ncbi:hypothetical protein [Stenotrophomonas sp.]|uniref:hypothetical protein n=1 Tax=Stenotrophomonas sp. TaxID=69392 RepID=UPI00289B76A2|nr:hypothetical protein [Stenotrophomonas sp.]